MKYSKELYEKKLINDLHLHDSEVIGMKYEDNLMTVEISCKGMNPEFYFEGIDDVTVKFSFQNIKKMYFDFPNSNILVNDFSLSKVNDGYVISINDKKDMYIEMENYSIDFEEHRNYNTNYKRLDEFLKSNK